MNQKESKLNYLKIKYQKLVKISDVYVLEKKEKNYITKEVYFIDVLRTL